MRDYGKVFSRIWESADFRSLSEDGRTLALYLLTCQHGTIAGVFRVPDGYACEDLQWESARVAEGFANLHSKGFATRCGASKWVWVAKFLEWNPPENPNQRKAAAKVAAAVPDDCCWKLDFLRSCGDAIGIAPPPPPAPPNPPVTVPEPFPNQYQKQEAGSEAEKKDSGSALRAPPPPPPFDGKNSESLNGKAIVQIAGDWELPEQWGVDAEALGWKPAQVLREAEKFRQYWTAGKGQGKRRTVKGWRQSWSNWLEKAAKDQR